MSEETNKELRDIIYEARSIDDCYEQCKDFAGSLYSEWRKVKAYALALEDDGWDIEAEEELCK